MVKSIKYNEIDFQANGWQTQDISYRNLPSKVLDTEPLVRRDGFRLVNAYYTQKDITISGSVTAATEAALRILVDTMKQALGENEKYLDIDDGGATVRWIATVTNIQVPEQHYHITTLPFSITFRCQPFGQATTALVNTNSITESASLTSSVVIVGSAAPRPTLKWELVGTPTLPVTAISFENNTTDDVITVTGLSLSDDGHYLTIDTEDMTVVYSTGSTNHIIDFGGIFPSFVTSTNSYTTTVVGGGAALSLLQSITYNASYL